MKKFIILLSIISIWTIIPLSLSAQEKQQPGSPLAYNGFSGGMMLHAGWLWAGRTTLTTSQGESLPTQNVAGLAYGIGGSVRFHFGNHLRIGTEGYGTYMHYGNENTSKFSIGWGGVCFDYQFHAGRLHPYAGVTVGGGSATNLTFLEHVDNDFITEDNVSYRKYGFMAVTPFIGIEYELNQRMRLTLKADWLMNVSNPQPDFPIGPRVYIGFCFYHLKK